MDDGSKDYSREIVAFFGDRVIAVLKENGGHSSAFNAGYTHSYTSANAWRGAFSIKSCQSPKTNARSVQRAI